MLKIHQGTDRLVFIGKKRVYKIPNFINNICNLEGKFKWCMDKNDLLKKRFWKSLWAHFQFGILINKIESHNASKHPEIIVKTQTKLLGFLNIQPKLKEIKGQHPAFWRGKNDPFYVYHKYLQPNGFEQDLKDFESKNSKLNGVNCLTHTFVKNDNYGLTQDEQIRLVDGGSLALDEFLSVTKSKLISIFSH